MRKAFTLVELLVVIAIISVLMAISLPVVRRVREQGAETVCRSNLRQMALILKTYANDHDSFFPDPQYIYHSKESFSNQWREMYPACCRWHDARINLDSPLLCQEHPELQGSLVSYLGGPWITRCKTGIRANLERGCNNACGACVHDPNIAVVPQYTYCMNSYLHATVSTGTSATGSFTGQVDPRTRRRTEVRKETQVTRSPAEVFAFGEQNSWAINVEGLQPIGPKPQWAAPCNLSGICSLDTSPGEVQAYVRPIITPALHIETTYRLAGNALEEDGRRDFADAFATYHRRPKGDLNLGHSYVSMLDGHVEKVTVADQLRKSRRVPSLPESRLGPGGNLYLAWPLSVPPPGGWENQ